MNNRRIYILFDSRACGGDTSRASVLEVYETNEQAREARGDYGAMACYSYKDDGKELTDQRLEWNWYPE